MAVSMILVLLVCFLMMMTTFMYIYRKNRHLPPGPYGLPIFGFMPFMGKNPVTTMTNLKKKYGSVVSISLGPRLIVILNDWNAMKEALITQGAIFSGRQYLPLSGVFFNDKDIIFTEGLKWKEQRNFAFHILRDFGFGRSSLESVIMYEVDKLTAHLNENAGKPIEINSLFFVPVINIIWNITCSKRFEKMDEFTLNFKKILLQITSLGSYNIVNYLSFLNPMLSKLNRTHREFWMTAKKQKRFFEKEVESHEASFQENNLRDFIDVYLAEIYTRREKNGKDIPPYDRAHLIGTITDLFVAGSETVDTTLCWALLHMSNEPTIQRKIQEELDRVVAKDSYLSVSSKALAPYTEATLLEIQRHPTLIPLSVAHKVTQDTILLGFKIPNGTLVYPNIYAVHHEPDYWGDAETFRPERFLDVKGTKVIKEERLVPFSIGKSVLDVEESTPGVGSSTSKTRTSNIDVTSVPCAAASEEVWAALCENDVTSMFDVRVLDVEEPTPEALDVWPRACMGESLAKMELHLFFTSLLRRFTFETIPGQPRPSMEPIPGSVFKTKPSYIIVNPRK